jgi:hypothetical protein
MPSTDEKLVEKWGPVLAGLKSETFRNPAPDVMVAWAMGRLGMPEIPAFVTFSCHPLEDLMLQIDGLLRTRTRMPYTYLPGLLHDVDQYQSFLSRHTITSEKPFPWTTELLQYMHLAATGHCEPPILFIDRARYYPHYGDELMIYLRKEYAADFTACRNRNPALFDTLDKTCVAAYKFLSAHPDIQKLDVSELTRSQERQLEPYRIQAASIRGIPYVSRPSSY